MLAVSKSDHCADLRATEDLISARSQVTQLTHLVRGFDILASYAMNMSLIHDSNSKHIRISTSVSYYICNYCIKHLLVMSFLGLSKTTGKAAASELEDHPAPGRRSLEKVFCREPFETFSNSGRSSFLWHGPKSDTNPKSGNEKTHRRHPQPWTRFWRVHKSSSPPPTKKTNQNETWGSSPNFRFVKIKKASQGCSPPTFALSQTHGQTNRTLCKPH